jgi:hypothetical protein
MYTPIHGHNPTISNGITMFTKEEKMEILSCFIVTDEDPWCCPHCSGWHLTFFQCPHGCGMMCKPECGCICFLYDEEYDESWKKLRNEYDVIKAATSGKESESMRLDTEDISAVTNELK